MGEKKKLCARKKKKYFSNKMRMLIKRTNISNTEWIVLASRSNAKKEKSRRNYIAARRFTKGKIGKNKPFIKQQDIDPPDDISIFMYSSDEAAMEAAKIITKK